MALEAGQLRTVAVRLRNLGDRLWPSLAREDSRYQLHLANRWLHEDGSLFQGDDVRAPLPYDIAPGAEAALLIAVHTPQVDGDYQLELDLVQEDVAWFQDRGSRPARVHCVVRGGQPPGPREPAPVPGRPRFPSLAPPPPGAEVRRRVRRLPGRSAAASASSPGWPTRRCATRAGAGARRSPRWRCTAFRGPRCSSCSRAAGQRCSRCSRTSCRAASRTAATG